jgi:hypothetical protein
MAVSTNLLIEPPRGYAIQIRQRGIQDHALSAHKRDRLLYLKPRIAFG